MRCHLLIEMDIKLWLNKLEAQDQDLNTNIKVLMKSHFMRRANIELERVVIIYWDLPML